MSFTSNQEPPMDQNNPNNDVPIENQQNLPPQNQSESNSIDNIQPQNNVNTENLPTSSSSNLEKVISLHIGPLSRETTENTLRTIFEQYGTVKDVKIPRNYETNVSKGYGFVTIIGDEAANLAISKVSKTIIDGVEVEVELSKPRQVNRHYENYRPNYRRFNGHDYRYDREFRDPRDSRDPRDRIVYPPKYDPPPYWNQYHPPQYRDSYERYPPVNYREPFDRQDRYRDQQYNRPEMRPEPIYRQDTIDQQNRFNEQYPPQNDSRSYKYE